MFNDGDDDNDGKAKKSQSEPIEPSEIDAPQGVDTLLGSESEKKENKKFL